MDSRPSPYWLECKFSLTSIWQAINYVLMQCIPVSGFEQMHPTMLLSNLTALQADFIVPSSREAVDCDSAWNEVLREQVPSLFLQALTSFRQLPAANASQPMAWVNRWLQSMPLPREVPPVCSALTAISVASMASSAHESVVRAARNRQHSAWQDFMVAKPVLTSQSVTCQLQSVLQTDMYDTDSATELLRISSVLRAQYWLRSVMPS